MLVIQERAARVLVCVVSEVDEEKRRELMLRGVPERCCQSYLWEQAVRDNVTNNKISEQVGSFLHLQKYYLTTISFSKHR